jgi:hypothetical protein
LEDDDTRPWPRVCPESERFGVTAGIGLADYDVGQLRAGWYYNFWTVAYPSHPLGMGFAQTIRLSNDYDPGSDPICSRCPTWDELSAVVEQNPGSLFFVGNEPDRVVVQDEVHPEQYAQLYHDFYTFLKAQDPTCQVAIGGVVQPTPLRLAYLDLILDAYRQYYRRHMPVDVWNVHNYILPEYPDSPTIGAAIPPGISYETAVALAKSQYDPTKDHDNLEIFAEHMTQMRQWMSDRGYRDHPLILSEFGVVLPEMDPYGYTEGRVQAYMRGTFDWLTTACDPDIGYSLDGNRLVQSWAWFTLNDEYEFGNRNTHLFESSEGRPITELGMEYARYTATLPTTAVDLELRSVAFTHGEPEGRDTVTFTLTANVYNSGTGAADQVVICFSPPGNEPQEVVVPILRGGEESTVLVALPGLPVEGLHEVEVAVDPDDTIPECDPNDNRETVRLFVASHRHFLPLVSNDW